MKRGGREEEEEILAKDISSCTISQGIRCIPQWYTWGPEIESSTEQNYTWTHTDNIFLESTKLVLSLKNLTKGDSEY